MPITPNYQRIVADIKRRIALPEGDPEALRPGDKLPSTSELREHYGVGNTAIRNAMLQLRAERIVVGHQGKGVYIAEAP